MDRRLEPSQEIVFEDRTAAGRALGLALARRGATCDVVLGLTRGGVPIGFEVAEALDAPLDILVVKKLRAPFSEELAIGAVCADGTRIVREDVLRELDVAKPYLDRELQERLAEARDADQRYRGGHAPLDVAGASVIIADDGIATGATMEAAVLSVRRRGARSILVAAPVASSEAWSALQRLADEVFCLATPTDFWAVGQFYQHFPPIADDEVRRLLDQRRAAAPKSSGHER